MFLGRRNTLSFCLCVFGFSCPRNSRTWPLTGLVFLCHSHFKTFFTTPNAEKWETWTTTWLPMIFSGLRTSIPLSSMWTTDSRPSGRAERTQSLVTTQDFHSTHCRINVFQRLSRLLNRKPGVGGLEAGERFHLCFGLEMMNCSWSNQNLAKNENCKVFLQF